MPAGAVDAVMAAMISDHSASTSSTSDDLPILDHYEIKHALLLL
jgi:hypothetical protein